MPPSSVSVRLSIRWLPGSPSEPTDTLVLTGGKTGVFLDVRFLKGTSVLDWAFAGYRQTLPTGDADTVQFMHHIDSRTLDARAVVDIGHNTALPGGQTLEAGEMVDPVTGRVTAYEEIWAEEEAARPGAEGGAVFVVNAERTAWRARVGGWQLGLGRRWDGEGGFWAWQAVWEGKEWVVRYAVGGEGEGVVFLPGREVVWTEGGRVEWEGDVWDVVELEE